MASHQEASRSITAGEALPTKDGYRPSSRRAVSPATSKLLAALSALLLLAPAAKSQCQAGTAAGTFSWSTSPGSGNEWLTTDQNDGDSRVYTINYLDLYGNANTVDVTLTVQDPNGRSCDANLVADPVNWPNDPDCINGSTETNGIFGSGFLTVVMKSLTSSETVQFDFTFSKPVFMDDFSMGDLDDVGFGFQPTVEPGDSFQDRISLVASNGGTNVPISLTGGSNLTIAGQTATAIVQVGVNGNLLPTDAPGTLNASTALVLDSFSFIYQNGPDDATNEGGPGISDSHAVRMSGFDFCIQDTPPALAVTKTASPAGAVSPGDTIDYTVTVTNNGPGNANLVTLTDTLPTGVTYVGSSAQKAYPAPVVGSFTSPNLGPNTFDTPGLTQTFDTTGSIPAGATLLTYGFTVSGSSTDFLSDIAMTATYPIGTAYTLPAGTFGGGGAGNYNQTRGPDPFGGPAEGTYQFLWSDSFDGVAGDDNTASSTVFTITYEADRALTVDAAGAPPNMVTAADNISLHPGETIVVTFSVTVDNPPPAGVTSLTNMAETAATGITPIDDDVTNPLGVEADLSITKTLSTAGPYSVGQAVTYQLVVSNAGPSTATNVVVTDAPTNLSITGVSGGGCIALPCTIATIPPGGSFVITVTGTVQ